MVRHALTAALALAACAAPGRARQERPAAHGKYTHVVAEGVGLTTEDARKDAFRSAVRQAVGAMIDAATLVQSAVLPDRPMKWSVEEVGWLLGHRNEKGGPVTLVFKDGRPPQQIHNYLLTATTLSVLDQRRQEIPVDQIDLAATAKVNRAAGASFALPGGSRFVAKGTHLQGAGIRQTLTSSHSIYPIEREAPSPKVDRRSSRQRTQRQHSPSCRVCKSRVWPDRLRYRANSPEVQTFYRVNRYPS